ncbi:VNG_1110C family protein [Halomarina oriensis]|uniref:Uncharacterized protein n=1 Tax=Halomarina oriensis TaxID=671145 RepID=A0A6B0GXJ8_9EURY|nr:hypothetical protein [Halomarina oriensis]MWG36865.1 hypothetical protein [Halomarina oriensis]
MSDAARYRDSTQIILPSDAIEDLRTDLGREFTLTFVDGEATRGSSRDRVGTDDRDDTVRIIGSPAEIKDASEWLTRHGVFVP